MNGMSKREYSTHSGLSRGATQNAKLGGRLVFYADGSINAAASDVRRADMTDPDQQRRSLGGDAVMPTNGGAGTDSYLKARTALTVYQAQERQLAIQTKKGTLVDRVAALMAAQVAAEVEKASGKPMVIEVTTMQRVLDAHVRAQLTDLADLRVSLG